MPKINVRDVQAMLDEPDDSEDLLEFEPAVIEDELQEPMDIRDAFNHANDEWMFDRDDQLDDPYYDSLEYE